MALKVTIINYGMGNHRSVANAFDALGCCTRISDRPKDLRATDRIVLPGVGAFGNGIRNLRAGGWIDELEEQVNGRGKPFLGLCLGMQLLATTGTEHGTHAGLGWIPGVVKRIEVDDPMIRVPHIGWNDVCFTAREGLYAGLGERETFYFLHSYVLHPEDSGAVSGVCTHGAEFVASVEMGNIWATQYHPEKSHKAGLRVLQNVLDLQG